MDEIRIESKENIVIAKIDDGNGYEWHFKYTVHDEATAQVVAKHFRNHLFEASEKIKDRYYQLGYKHGKHHQSKIR